jgi:hypothetical protein
MDEIRFDRLAKNLRHATCRRGALRAMAAAGLALLATRSVIAATGAKKKSRIKKIACRLYTKENYQPCIDGSTGLCEDKATWEYWDLADCLARYVPCCEHFKNCKTGGELAAECQEQYVISIRPV